MTRENIKDAFAFHVHWCNLNGCARERDFEGETCAIVQALHNFDYLNLRGGLLRLDGEVIAFTFGCKLCRICSWYRLKRPTTRFRARTR